MNSEAFQDYYPDHMAYCYGCGRLNDQGYHIRSLWDGEESVCHFLPEAKHIAIPGYVYGGLLASLIDCHGTGTAAAAGYRAEARPMDSEPALRYLTASLHVDYLKPTPLGVTLEVRGIVQSVEGRRVTIDEWITASGEVTVRGKLVAVQVPDRLVQELLQRQKPAKGDDPAG
jgi:acyl-coenzyme A thioesterase PaaI-like protein